MLKNKIPLLIFTSIILCAALLVYNYTAIFSNKIVTVNYTVLFDNFQMTRELKQAGSAQYNLQVQKIDSLYKVLNSSKNDPVVQEHVLKMILIQKDSLNRFEVKFVSEQSDKIWTRIKTYSKDFAVENKYHIVIGSDSKSTILFSSPETDVTSQLLSYINKKYDGFK